MERLALSFRVLLCSVALAVSSARGAAQDSERVATFVVSGADDGPALVDEALAQLRSQFAKDGRREVRPDIEWPSDRDVGLNGARAVGRSAFSELAEGKPPEDVLRTYGAPIAKSLNQVSAVQDPEGRSLLWNLCALRVRLLLLTGGDSGEQATREAVLDCSRRFIDRPTVGKAWLQEVARTFQRFMSAERQVPVSVKTAPAGCELRVYGAAVGVTPIIVDLIPGAYEFQVVCEGREGAVHRVSISEARDLTIRLEADRAYATRSGASWVRYKGGTASAQVLDDVGALALEAGADSFVVVRADRGPELEVQWFRPPATLLGASVVRAHAAPGDRAQTIARVFRPDSVESVADISPARRRHRIWADYALGGAFVVAGVAWSAYALTAIVRDGQCVDAGCDWTYVARDWKGSLSLAAAGALVATGVAVLWVGPFGKRRYSVAVANGLVVRGSF